MVMLIAHFNWITLWSVQLYLFHVKLNLHLCQTVLENNLSILANTAICKCKQDLIFFCKDDNYLSFFYIITHNFLKNLITCFIMKTHLFRLIYLMYMHVLLAWVSGANWDYWNYRTEAIDGCELYFGNWNHT